MNRLLALVMVLALAPAAAAVEGLRIENVSPQVAQPGDIVTLLLSRDVGAGQDVVVTFAGVQARRELAKGRSVRVVVPSVGKPGEMVPITCRVGSDVARYGDFRIEPATTSDGGSETEQVAPSKRPSLLQRIPIWVRRFQVPLLLTAVIGTGFFLALVWRWREQRHRLLTEVEAKLAELERLREELRQEGAGAAGRADAVATEAQRQEAPQQPPPAPPQELLEPCGRGQCVLFAGSDLAAAAGYQTRQEFLRGLAEALADQDALGLVERGDLDSAAEVVNTNLSHEVFVERVRELYGTPANPAEVPRLLAQIPFREAISVSWAPLFDSGGAGRAPRVHVPQEVRGVEESEDPATDSFPVTLLYGDPGRPDTLTLSPSQVTNDVTSNRPLQRIVSSRFYSATFFFCGATTAEIEHFLNAFRISQPGGPHFALIGVEDDLSAKQRLFESRYGIRLLVFHGPSSEVTGFLRELASGISDVDIAAPGPLHIEPRKLTGLRLENIGPFAELDLSFHERWNVLLGNNGCGKSTMLKAICVALAGEDQRAHVGAAKLLRQGQKEGTIEIRVGNETYTTVLTRRGSHVNVEARRATPVESATWPVFAFPPLRGVSTREVKGPDRDPDPSPDVRDILPILTGDIDDRLDSLKQWIVNTDARSKNPDLDSSERDRANALLDSFFELMRVLTPGVKLRRGHVDKNFEVWIETGGDTVPMGLISQGMSSVLGWAGYTLQRLAAIYPGEGKPEGQPALALIDELDAHMHPWWQMMIVSSMKQSFGNLQVIATTHSPLIVANMEQNEVKFVTRSERGVDVTPAPESFKGWRVDQILTSPAFDLPGTRDVDTNRDLKEYLDLAGKFERTPDETRRLEILAKELNTQLPSSQSEETGMKAYAILQDSIRKHVDGMPEERKEEILREARAQLKGYSTEPGPR